MGKVATLFSVTTAVGDCVLKGVIITGILVLAKLDVFVEITGVSFVVGDGEPFTAGVRVTSVIAIGALSVVGEGMND
jgi:hypothetical protein